MDQRRRALPGPVWLRAILCGSQADRLELPPIVGLPTMGLPIMGLPIMGLPADSLAVAGTYKYLQLQASAPA